MIEMHGFACWETVVTACPVELPTARSNRMFPALPALVKSIVPVMMTGAAAETLT